LFKGDLPAQENQQIQEEVVQQEDYHWAKMNRGSEAANREAGQTQQRQVTEPSLATCQN
jgi:preprotein translocase subunit SecA